MRYQWPCPGQLLHMDVKRFGRFEQPGHALTGDRSRRSRRAGWEYVHSIVDDCSRLAYSEVHGDERAATVTAFSERALGFFLEHGIVAERLLTDNAFACVHNTTLKALLQARAIEHWRTKPYTLRTNGKVERYHQTLQREMGLGGPGDRAPIARSAGAFRGGEPLRDNLRDTVPSASVAVAARSTFAGAV